MNMKFWFLFSRSVGISLESRHLERRINPDGAFRIFCHANCLKRRTGHERGNDMPTANIIRFLENGLFSTPLFAPKFFELFLY